MVLCLQGITAKRWVAENVRDHNTFSASPQIDLGLLNFGPLHLSAGQQCKSKANRSLRVPNDRYLPAVQANKILFPCICVLSGTIHFTAEIKVHCTKSSLVIGGMRGVKRDSTHSNSFQKVKRDEYKEAMWFLLCIFKIRHAACHLLVNSI